MKPVLEKYVFQIQLHTISIVQLYHCCHSWSLVWSDTQTEGEEVKEREKERERERERGGR